MKLTYVDASNNAIADPFPKIQSNSLRYLVLKNNPIQLLKKPVSPPALPNLIYLDLSGIKQCKALQSQSFAFLTSLKTLILNDCQFINISNDALLGLSRLAELHL